MASNAIILQPRSAVDPQDAGNCRSRILTAAREILQTNPYRCFSVEEVAARSGVERRTVNKHFGRRNSLYRASRSELLFSFEFLLPSYLPPGASLGECLLNYSRAALAALGSDEHRELYASVLRDAGEVPWIRSLYEEHVEAPLLRTLEHHFMAQRLRGGIPHADPCSLAHAGLGLVLRAAGEGGASSDLHCAAVAAELMSCATTRTSGKRTGSKQARPARRSPGDAAPNSPMLSEWLSRRAHGLDPQSAEGGERRPLVKRGAISVTMNPTELRWNGRLVPLSPLEAEIVALVVRRGRVRWEDVKKLLAEQGGSMISRDVLIYRIRRKFALVGGADPLVTVRGWGLKLRVEPDQTGSKSLWIGASETSPFPSGPPARP
jgi:AcrR family transcriptional regulator